VVPLAAAGARRGGAPVVGRGGRLHGKVGGEVRTIDDEEIGRKDEGELTGATGGDAQQRRRGWSSCGGRN
jgi:hypothetical protein